MPEKLNLLIDTNSLVHLSKIELGNKLSGDDWVFEYFNVFQIEQIITEYDRNIKKQALFNRKNPDRKKHSFKKQHLRNFKNHSQEIKIREIELLERNIVAHYYKKALGQDDRGERHLIAGAIGAVYLKKINYCIVLTDDFSAMKKFIGAMKEDFKFGDIWNVFDVILYLFLTRKNLPVDAAKNAIRTLCALSSIPVKFFIEKRNAEMTEAEARARMGLFYINKIDMNNKLRSFL